MKFTKKLCGSQLEILIHDEWEFSDLIQKSFEYGEYFEKKYSRFIENNFLDTLNKNKYTKDIDVDFYNIISLAQNISKISEWYFDITILPFLENKWYWKSSEKIIENIWYKNIILEKNSLELKNNIFIDIWALWKWFIVDKIYHILDKWINNFTLNFWWDIRVKWEKNILLEDPSNENKIIWSINLKNSSLASSSGLKRNFWEHHHLINAHSWNSQHDIIWVFVQHNSCVFADSFSTALFVSPIDVSINVLKKMKWLEAMILLKNGKIHKTKWFNFIQNSLWK